MPVTPWMPARAVAGTGWGKVTGFNQVLVGFAGTEIQADDGDFAAFMQTVSMTTDYLICTDFDFASVLPSGATVTGVEVEALAVRDSTGTYAVVNTQVWEWGAGAPINASFGDVDDWPTTQGALTYSTPTSTTRSEAIDVGYGCAFKASLGSGRNSFTAKHLIGRVRMRLTYTDAPAGAKRRGGARFL